MKQPLSILKNRLKLKKLTKQLEKACDDNFGYSPNHPWFDELLERQRVVFEEVQKADVVWFTEVFQKYEYADNVKNMPVFWIATNSNTITIWIILFLSSPMVLYPIAWMSAKARTR